MTRIITMFLLFISHQIMASCPKHFSPEQFAQLGDVGQIIIGESLVSTQSETDKMSIGFLIEEQAVGRQVNILLELDKEEYCHYEGAVREPKAVRSSRSLLVKFRLVIK